MGQNLTRDELRLIAIAAFDAILGVIEEPGEEMWDGLPRAIMMWLDFGPSERTPRALFKHLERAGHNIPQWLRDEPEMRELDHVPSKGTRCVILHRAMLSTLKETK